MNNTVLELGEFGPFINSYFDLSHKRLHANSSFNKSTLWDSV